MLLVKQVNHDIDEVQHHPLGTFLARDMIDGLPRALAVRRHRIGDGAKLPVARARADHEVVRHRADAAKVQNDNVLGLVLLGVTVVVNALAQLLLKTFAGPGVKPQH